MSATRSALGIDLGGTKIAVAAVTEAGATISESRAPTRADEGPEAVTDRIAAAARETLEKIGAGAEVIESIGVGVPGQLDAERHVVLSAPNLRGWSEFPLAEELGSRLDGRPVYLENDANLAAVAEHAFGAGRGVDDLILLTLGTGVGGGIILEGELITGAHGWAGELGHLIIDADGPFCGMGHRGCLESLASGTAIAREARERPTARGGGFRDLADEDAAELTARRVAEAARQGDEACIRIFEAAGRYLGLGIASFVLALDPAVVILGGSLVQVGKPLLEPARRAARSALFPAAADRLRIVTTDLEGRAGVLGAALLALRGED